MFTGRVEPAAGGWRAPPVLLVVGGAADEGHGLVNLHLAEGAAWSPSEAGPGGGGAHGSLVWFPWDLGALCFCLRHLTARDGDILGRPEHGGLCCAAGARGMAIDRELRPIGEACAAETKTTSEFLRIKLSQHTTASAAASQRRRIERFQSLLLEHRAALQERRLQETAGTKGEKNGDGGPAMEPTRGAQMSRRPKPGCSF